MRNILLFLSTALLLTACLEYQEKMKLNSDGSGDVTFAFGISESVLNFGGNSNDLKDFNESKIRDEFKDKKGIKVISTRTYSQSGQRWIELKLSFESLKDLMAASSDSTQQTVLGEMTLTENADGKMVYTRKLYKEGNSTSDDTTGKAIGQGMMEMMFGQYKWNYEVTFPGKVISSNAAPNDIDYSTNTVKWTISMASLARPQLMTVIYEKPLSKLTIISMIAAAIVVIVVLILILLKLKNKPN